MEIMLRANEQTALSALREAARAKLANFERWILHENIFIYVWENCRRKLWRWREKISPSPICGYDSNERARERKTAVKPTVQTKSTCRQLKRRLRSFTFQNAVSRSQFRFTSMSFSIYINSCAYWRKDHRLLWARGKRWISFQHPASPQRGWRNEFSLNVCNLIVRVSKLDTRCHYQRSVQCYSRKVVTR